MNDWYASSRDFAGLIAGFNGPFGVMLAADHDVAIHNRHRRDFPALHAEVQRRRYVHCDPIHFFWGGGVLEIMCGESEMRDGSGQHWPFF